MEIRAKERMDVITEYLKIAREHSDTVQLKVTDGYYINFGRTYYHIDFEILNKDGSECYSIHPNQNGRITWYAYHEAYYMINNMEVLDNINKEIRKDFEWVKTMVDYYTYHKGNVSINWRPTTIDREDTRIKPEPKEKEFEFERKDDILEEYNDVVKLIDVEKRALETLEGRRLGLAKEYYNRKNNFNVGDIVHMEDWGGNLEFGVIDSMVVYKSSERRGKDENPIEDEYGISIHTTLILKSGKAKKNNWGTSNVKGVICKEKEFTKYAFDNGVKSILNKDNLTKLYNKLKTVKEYEY